MVDHDEGECEKAARDGEEVELVVGDHLVFCCSAVVS